MKSPFILFLLLTSSLSLLADSYHTLSGARDTLTIAKDETVFIVNATDDLIASVEQPSKPCLQVQFAHKEHYSPVRQITNRSSRPQIINVSTQAPFILAGPAKITLRTTGILTLKRETTVKTRRFTSSSQGVRRMASR